MRWSARALLLGAAAVASALGCRSNCERSSASCTPAKTTCWRRARSWSAATPSTKACKRNCRPFTAATRRPALPAPPTSPVHRLSDSFADAGPPDRRPRRRRLRRRRVAPGRRGAARRRQPGRQGPRGAVHPGAGNHVLRPQTTPFHLANIRRRGASLLARRPAQHRLHPRSPLEDVADDGQAPRRRAIPCGRRPVVRGRQGRDHPGGPGATHPAPPMPPPTEGTPMPPPADVPTLPAPRVLPPPDPVPAPADQGPDLSPVPTDPARKAAWHPDDEPASVRRRPKSCRPSSLRIANSLEPSSVAAIDCAATRRRRRTGRRRTGRRRASSSTQPRTVPVRAAELPPAPAPVRARPRGAAARRPGPSAA